MKTYINGNYRVYLFDNGTKMRVCDDDIMRPSRAESIDVSLSEKCSIFCNVCYANCTPTGKHAKLFNEDETPVYWLSTVPQYTELACNGNDMDHPQLEMFLHYCKDHNIIVNMTFHQKQFIFNYKTIRDYQKQKLLHGIGISISNPTDELIYLIKSTPNAVCHVIAGIVSDEVLDILSNNNLKLLILGYKIKGRGKYYAEDKLDEIQTSINHLKDKITELTYKFNTVTFDCLAVEQLSMKDQLTEAEWNTYFMGKDGTSTFYIDAVNENFSKSSTEIEYYNISDFNSVTEMFKFIRLNDNLQLCIKYNLSC